MAERERERVCVCVYVYMCGDDKCFEYTDFSSDKLPESERERDRYRVKETKN